MKNTVKYLAIGVFALTVMLMAPAANAGRWSIGYHSGPAYYGPAYPVTHGYAYRHHRGHRVRVYAPAPCYRPYYGPHYGPAWGGWSFTYRHR